MAIKTSTFGGIHLSGKDADRFIQHMREDGPNLLAKKAFTKGMKLVKEFKEKGYATLQLKKKK